MKETPKIADDLNLYEWMQNPMRKTNQTNYSINEQLRLLYTNLPPKIKFPKFLIQQKRIIHVNREAIKNENHQNPIKYLSKKLPKIPNEINSYVLTKQAAAEFFNTKYARKSHTHSLSHTSYRLSLSLSGLSLSLALSLWWPVITSSSLTSSDPSCSIRSRRSTISTSSPRTPRLRRRESEILYLNEKNENYKIN